MRLRSLLGVYLVTLSLASSDSTVGNLPVNVSDVLTDATGGTGRGYEMGIEGSRCQGLLSTPLIVLDDCKLRLVRPLLHSGWRREYVEAIGRKVLTFVREICPIL
jgi:hypothetical protein